MEYLKKLFAPVDMTVGKPWENILIFRSEEHTSELQSPWN